MSVADIAAELRRAVAALPVALLDQVASLLDEARTIFTQATQGSQRPERVEALAHLEQAARLLGQVSQTSVAVQRLIETYLANIGAGVGQKFSVAPQSEATGARQVPAAPVPGQALPPNKLAALKDELPPPVPKPNPTGRKTHGRWLDEDGQTRAEVSGRDEDSAEAWRILQAAKIPLPSEPVIVTHIEVKLAARMVREKRRHVEIAINNRPCPGRFGCEVLLSTILPEGYSITLHGPGYRQTFVGGKKPWWR